MVDIFYDIDGCLLDYEFEPNMDLKKLVSLVSKAKEKGVILHINSNRSRASILKVYNQLKFNGCIISENGAEAYDPVNNNVKACASEFFDKNLLAKILSKDSASVMFTHTDILIKNPQEFIRKIKHDSITYFCEQTRRFTITIYPRKIEKKEFMFDKMLLSETKEKLEKDYKDYNVEIDPRYGNVLISPRHVSKGFLLKKVASSKTIASFGDGEQDIAMFEVSDICGAPANADDKVKSKILKLKGFLSDKKFTLASYEFLKKVLGGLD